MGKGRSAPERRHASLADTLLDSAPDALLLVDRAGRIVFANRAAEALFHYVRADLLEQPLERVLRARHGAATSVQPHRSPSRAKAHSTVRSSAVGHRKDGRVFPVEMASKRLRVDGRVFSEITVRDVSNRKAAETRLKRARVNADRARRATAEFLAAASHDLRQPLQALTLLNGHLVRMLELTSEARELVAEQSSVLDALRTLIEPLLETSKLELGAQAKMVVCNLQPVLNRQRDLFSIQAREKGLRFNVDPCEATIRTDPALLEQILRNLVSNALRYTSRGWVKLSCAEGAATVRLEVRDSGIGLPLDGRIATSRGFARLGLSIVRRATDLLGAKLQIESTPGRGSCFSVTVPKA
jgi:PAS domain S-box-containing protein